MTKAAMTKRERVLASIRREVIDAIPWQIDVTSAVAARLKTHYGTEDLLSATGSHLVCVPSLPPLGYEEESCGPGLVRTEFGSIWRRAAIDTNYGDWGELVSHPIKEPSLAGYSFPYGSSPGRWRHIKQVRRDHPDHFLVADGYGLFENAWGLCGFENYLGYVAGEEEFVEAVTDKLAEFSCGVTAQLLGTGVDCIRFGDDWGFQDRLMMRAENWRRIFKKHYRRVYSAAHDAGLIVMIHSCGNITEILPDLIEIGVQIVNPLQPESMDIDYCRREFGHDLTFYGGLGSQSTIPYGTPEDNQREVQERLEQFKDGGYILAPAGAAPSETPVENIAAIVDAAKMQAHQQQADELDPCCTPVCGNE